MTIELALDSTPAAPVNPTGLDLIGNAQQALAAYIDALVTARVEAAVSAALADASIGAVAATLMDDTLNERIRGVCDDMLDNLNYPTKEWVSNHVEGALSDHCSDYDHDDFLTDDNLRSTVRAVIRDAL